MNLAHRILSTFLLSLFVSSVMAGMPNVIVIMTDDQGYGEFSVHGNPITQTPHIDRLAKDGYVERVSCPSDRRVQWAQLTDDGVATVDSALETHLADLDGHFFTSMSDAERATLVPVLDRLRASCSEA